MVLGRSLMVSVFVNETVTFTEVMAAFLVVIF